MNMNENLLQRSLPAHFFDFWAAHLNPLWSLTRPLARVVARRQESADSVTLVLQPNRHVPDWLPGQHLQVTVEVNGRRLQRSYSPRLLASGRLAITIKRVDGGKVSQWLCDPARVGSLLKLSYPFGDMTPARLGSDNLLLAAGSGITPFISLIEQAERLSQMPSLTLLYWVRDAADACFVAELEALAVRVPQFRFQLFNTGAGDARLHAAHFAEQPPASGERRVFACGPAGFVATASALADAGNLTFLGEAFSLPAQVADSDATVQLHLQRSGRVLTVPAGQTLLLALEAQGLQPEHGCRMGICNTCVCGKASGTSEDVLTGRLDSEAGGSLRLCISRARTDLTLDL